MRIGLAFNQRPDDVVVDHDGDRRTTFEPLTDAFVEWDDAETIAAVRDALGLFGEVVPLEAVDDFPMQLRDARVRRVCTAPTAKRTCRPSPSSSAFPIWGAIR